MLQALTLSPVVRNYGINLGALYRASGASPVSGTCIVCVCVCVCGGGWGGE